MEDAVDFACEVNGETDPLWACALARGALEPLASGSKDAEKGGGRADLAWGGGARSPRSILARAAARPVRGPGGGCRSRG